MSTATVSLEKQKCMVCASFTEEQQLKIVNRRQYISKDESELLGEPDQGNMFEGSQQELEQAAQFLISSYQAPL